MKVAFLDRDGVINRDSEDYIKSWEEFSFLPGAVEGMAVLNRAGYEVILITNQSGIGRGLFTEATLRNMHTRLAVEAARGGARVLAAYYCPHLPDDGCGCRKPEAGMLLAARDRFGLDLSACVMIGDSAKDIRAARAAGLGRAVLVQTGNGPHSLEKLVKEDAPPDLVAADLLDAAQRIAAGD
ncbi:MAG: D-glycero-beta-D-manno-heptose 1,7-bisphosphate 7-phosphatase [Pseudomonadota bacterium]